MSRFRYVLEPVALQRQWAIDSLLREIGDCNHALKSRQQEHEAALAQLSERRLQMLALCDIGQSLQLDRQLRLSEDLRRRYDQVDALCSACRALDRQREQLVQALHAAQQALDAIKKHRRRSHAAYLKTALGKEFRDVDDQWSLLYTVRGGNGK